MATRPITRLAAAAVVTGITTLALASPASAQFPKEPELGSRVEPTGSGTVTSTDSGFDYGALAGGALGGIALAGAGVAAAAGLRRHHLAHPA